MSAHRIVLRRPAIWNAYRIAIAFLALNVSVMIGPPVSGEALAGKIRVACVGDSITYGPVPNRLINSWPGVLQRILGARYNVVNFGRSCATISKHGDVPYWNVKAFRAATAFNSNIVIIALGTNDSKPMNWDHGKYFSRDTRDLILHFEHLKTHPKVFLWLPLPVLREYKPKHLTSISQYMIRNKVVPALRKVAAAMHVPVIDVYNAMARNKKYYDSDGIHPDVAGEKIIGQAIARVILRHEVHAPAGH